MRKSLEFKNETAGTLITVSDLIVHRLGPQLGPFTRMLNDLMEALSIERAIVSRSGSAVAVYLVRSDGWTNTMHIGAEKKEA